MKSKSKDRLKPLTKLEIYEHLRMAHQEIKEILRSYRYSCQGDDVINAIEAIHEYLYMAKDIVIRADK